MLKQKSLPPSPQRLDSIENVPRVPSKDNNTMFHTPIVSGTKSLPSRNTSLKQLPIPSTMLTPNSNSVQARPPNVRSVSAHQSVNGRPVSYQQQLQNRPPLPAHNSHLIQQQPPLLPHGHHLQQMSSMPSLHSPYMQQQQQSSPPVISPEPTQKKQSFMRSVMAAVSSPRSSFRQSKSNMKPVLDTNAPAIEVPSMNGGPLPTSTSFRGPVNNNITQNMSTVSLDQQTRRPVDPSAQLRRYSAANLSEPQLSPQHLNIPPPQSPFGPRTSTINNHSTPSFISSVNSSSQTSLALTPPLSRSSSPGSMTPAVLNRYTSASSSSSEDLGSPPESVSFSFFVYFLCVNVTNNFLFF
jgi:hypothetical protein